MPNDVLNHILKEWVKQVTMFLGWHGSKVVTMTGIPAFWLGMPMILHVISWLQGNQSGWNFCTKKRKMLQGTCWEMGASDRDIVSLVLTKKSELSSLFRLFLHKSGLACPFWFSIYNIRLNWWLFFPHRIAPKPVLFTSGRLVAPFAREKRPIRAQFGLSISNRLIWIAGFTNE